MAHLLFLRYPGLTFGQALFFMAHVGLFGEDLSAG